MRAKGPESKDARQAVRSLVITHTGVVCECVAMEGSIRG